MKASATGSWARPGSAPPGPGEFASLGERATSWGLEVTAEVPGHWVLVGGAGHQGHRRAVVLLAFPMSRLVSSACWRPFPSGALSAEGSAHRRGSPSAITAPGHCGPSFLPPRGLRGTFPLWQVMFLIRAPELTRNMAQDSDCNCSGVVGGLSDVTLFLPVAPRSPRAVLAFLGCRAVGPMAQLSSAHLHVPCPVRAAPQNRLIWSWSHS